MKTAISVSIPSFAKINLDLRVLGRRQDGYHEVRTIYQTISLQDQLRIEYKPSKRIDLDIESSVGIEDNIVLKAARAVLEYLDVTASVRFELNKTIPIGGGLGGGSSNAAAVLLALPALARKRLSMAEIQRLGSWLGSDVPFFFHGGTAIGLGRGTELYPLPDLPAHDGVVVASGIHVSTAEAYQDLGRPFLQADENSAVSDSLTSVDSSHILGEFQAVTWSLDRQPIGQISFVNDFEPVVFSKHAKLAELLQELKQNGGNPVRMTGSGSALFGIFPDSTAAKRAAQKITGATPVCFIRREEYREHWSKALGDMASYCSLFEKTPN
jgi:4-diphosphocytidyl-2-C-methyl-D-erythritol kinase